jgi:flavin-dependent dehydrogenase
MSSVRADVAIAGGGPAGAALAIELARRGVRVNLYEKATFPRLKACGEGLLPHGVAALSTIATLPSAPRVRGLRFVAAGSSVDVDFPEGFGLVVRRDRFDAWLFEKAAATPLVDARMGTPYRGEGERCVVGADGRRSMFHRRLTAIRPVRYRIGLAVHVGGLEGVRDQVEVFFHPRGELYVAPTGEGEALVAALFHRHHFRRDGVTYLLQAIPELRERSAGIEMTTAVLAAAPLGLHVPRIVDGELLLIGDAAGAPDPITGDGMAMALTSAALAADAIVSGDLGAYEAARLAMGRRAERLGRLLLAMARAEGSAARAMLRRPSLAATLLDVALARRPMNAATLVRAALGRLQGSATSSAPATPCSPQKV